MKKLLLYVTLGAVALAMAACDSNAPATDGPEEVSESASPFRITLEVTPPESLSTEEQSQLLKHRKKILEQAAQERPSLKRHLGVKDLTSSEGGLALSGTPSPGGSAAPISSSQSRAQSVAAATTGDGDGLEERGDILFAQTSYEGDPLDSGTFTLTQNGATVSQADIRTSLSSPVVLHQGTAGRGDAVILDITNATYGGEPFYGPTVPLSDMVTGRYFGEWATAATLVFEQQLPDGSWQEIGRAGIEFYHIPDVAELDVTTTPISKLYDGDTTSVRVAGVGSDGQPAKLPQETIINASADDGGAGVGALYWMGSNGPYVEIHNMPLADLNAGALTYVVPETADDPPPAQPAGRNGAQAQAAFVDSTITDVALAANLTSKPGISGTRALPVSELTRPQALDAFFSENPHALLDVPCDQIPAWETVGEYTPPQSVMDRLEYLQNNRRTFWETYIEGADWQVQQLSEANGTRVNMDYFTVSVTALPNGMSAPDLFAYIRANMPTTDSTTFLDEDVAALEVYPDLPDEEDLWLSEDPLSSILSFQIKEFALGANVNDASVITSDYLTDPSSSFWTFTTIKTPGDWRHPVTGNRKFGFVSNADGSYTFYTRGVDRVTSWVDTGNQLAQNALGKIIGKEGLDVAFNSADVLWYDFAERVANYVNANGGSAYPTQSATTYRPRWSKVKGFLDREKDLAVLVGCSTD